MGSPRLKGVHAIRRVPLNMPKVTITNNYPHHIRAKITAHEIIRDQIKETKEKKGSAGVKVDVPLAGAGGGVGGGGGSATSKKQSDIKHLQLETPGFTIIDAGKIAVLSYSKKDKSFLTLEININGQYVRKVDCQQLDQDQSSSFSVSEKGSFEKTGYLEKYLGIGHNDHRLHDPTNPANMN